MPAVSVQQAFCIKGYLSAICGPPLMLDCVIMDSVTRIIVCQKFSLILSGKSLKESCYLIYLGRSQLYSTLIDTHIADSVFESLAGSVMVVRPCMLDITKSWNLETMTVTLDLSFLITSVIFVCKFEASVSKIMTAESHEFI